MAKATERSGFNNLSGANNPRIVYSDEAPLTPKIKDMWVDTVSNGIYRWNGTNWILLSIINQNTNIGLMVWVGTAAEYAAIVTTDPDTLYFVIP